MVSSSSHYLFFFFFFFSSSSSFSSIASHNIGHSSPWEPIPTRRYLRRSQIQSDSIRFNQNDIRSYPVYASRANLNPPLPPFPPFLPSYLPLFFQFIAHAKTKKNQKDNNKKRMLPFMHALTTGTHHTIKL